MAFKASVTFVNLQAVLEKAPEVSDYENIKGVLHFQGLATANLITDADSLNQYFTADTGSPNAESFGLSDLPAISSTKSFTDTPTITEDIANAFSTSFSDAPSISESLAKSMEFIRAFSDTPSVAEALAHSLGKAADDSFGASDSPVLSAGKALSDTPSIADAVSSLAVGLSPSDTPTVSESFARTVTFARSFSDTSTLDDAASAEDDSAVQTGINKSNTVTVSESVDIEEGKGFSDSSSVSEAIALLVSPVFADSTTISESINVSLLRRGGPLNAASLNSDMLNA